MHIDVKTLEPFSYPRTVPSMHLLCMSAQIVVIAQIQQSASGDSPGLVTTQLSKRLLPVR